MGLRDWERTLFGNVPLFLRVLFRAKTSGARNPAPNGCGLIAWERTESRQTGAKTGRNRPIRPKTRIASGEWRIGRIAHSLLPIRTRPLKPKGSRAVVPEIPRGAR